MDNIHWLPAHGPLNIKSSYQYLQKSKADFAKKDKIIYSETIKDFKILRKIGVGADGDIYLIKHRKTKKLYAAKTVNMINIINRSNLKRVKMEKHIMERLNNPFIITLSLFTFDNSYIYFISPYYSGGDLLENIEVKGKFNESESRFFGAQVVLALEYLHFLNIIYRDVKPENVVLDHTGYIKIIDFRFAKLCRTRTYSACGTMGYMAPEIYSNKGYGRAVDFWALGVMLFEITYGRMPSFLKDPKKLMSVESASNIEFKMPYDFSEEFGDLLRNLLQVDLTKRFGNLKGGIDDIKDHAWFRPIMWMQLLNRQLKPPYKPLERSLAELDKLEEINLETSEKEVEVSTIKELEE